MQIAIDCRLWNEGGVGRYLRNLVLELSKIDSQNEYTLFFWKKAPKITAANFRTQITQVKWHSLKEQTIFWRELEKGQFSLVHFPYFSYPILYRRPFVLTIHDLTIKHFFTGRASTRPWLMYALKRQAYLKILAEGIKNSRRVLVPSQFVKQDLLDNYRVDAAKIQVTYEGLGSEFLNTLPTKPKDSPRDFLLYVGNAYPHKNVEFLLSVLSRSLEEKLVVYGPDDFFTARLKRLVENLSLSKRVYFFTHHSEAELIWFYRQARALVFPSLAEGFGLPVVEAARFGCPLLLSDLPVFREIAPSGAIFFDPRNEESLAKKIANLKNHKLKVPADYFAKFSFARMAKETLAVYKNQ